MTTFYSTGKLLLTGEYVVLDGALSLAVPTQKGQSLIIKEIHEPLLVWKSIDDLDHVWFQETFKLEHFESSQCDSDIGTMLLKILTAAKKLNPNFLKDNQGYEISTILEFPRDWGLGSSSTLINNIANWAAIDAYQLLELTFGGSGYDIACAQNLGPLTYQLHQKGRTIHPVSFYPKFSEHLYFVHLNKKQNSREGIARYRSNHNDIKTAISKINAITKLIIQCDSLITFEGLIDHHEAIISKLINLPTVKESLFNDYHGAIKSLGAWGGDFILVTSKDNPSSYFKDKGFATVVPYKNMIIK